MSNKYSKPIIGVVEYVTRNYGASPYKVVKHIDAVFPKKAFTAYQVFKRAEELGLIEVYTTEVGEGEHNVGVYATEAGRALIA